MKSNKSMNRLVQGDVGSGKTLVALDAAFVITKNGYQAAMMAPTEVLARQHYENITKLFEEYHIPVKVVLLTGSMTAKEKRKVYDNPGRIAAYRDGSIWRMVIVVFALELDKEPEMIISSESKELRFFTKEELKEIEIVVTHSDIVEDWFISQA